MTDTNPTRARYAHNKAAFQEVFGDPFADDAPEGHYNLLKRRSPNRSIECTIGEGRGTANLARPCSSDFFCDAENALSEVITVEKELTKFRNTYILGESDNILSQTERNRLEQRIGKLLLARRIAPVSRYFLTLRQPSRG